MSSRFAAASMASFPGAAVPGVVAPLKVWLSMPHPRTCCSATQASTSADRQRVNLGSWMAGAGAFFSATSCCQWLLLMRTCVQMSLTDIISVAIDNASTGEGC